MMTLSHQKLFFSTLNLPLDSGFSRIVLPIRASCSPSSSLPTTYFEFPAVRRWSKVTADFPFDDFVVRVIKRNCGRQRITTSDLKRVGKPIRFNNAIWFVRDMFLPSTGQFAGLKVFLVWHPDAKRAWDNEVDRAATTAAVWPAYYENGLYLSSDDIEKASKPAQGLHVHAPSVVLARSVEVPRQPAPALPPQQGARPQRPASVAAVARATAVTRGLPQEPDTDNEDDGSSCAPGLTASIHAATSIMHVRRTRGGPVGIMKPLVIKDYTFWMGGVDLTDQKRSYNEIKLQVRKWTTQILFWLIDAVITNAQCVWEPKNGRKVPTSVFRRKLCRQLVNLRPETKRERELVPASPRYERVVRARSATSRELPCAAAARALGARASLFAAYDGHVSTKKSGSPVRCAYCLKKGAGLVKPVIHYTMFICTVCEKIGQAWRARQKWLGAARCWAVQPPPP
jgi:hypothetical protein